MDEFKMVDKKTLAKMVGRSVRTIERWKLAGKLPPVNPVLTRPTWTMQQIVIWLRHTATNSDTTPETN